jgi:predicted phosphodiesterase
MRFAIFGDIHANLHALEAVMADTREQGCTHHICMGDVVGYNAFPKECLAIVRDLDCPVVKGNHDEQVSMDYTQEGLNPLAEEALDWTRDRLDEADKHWLRELRIQRLIRDFTIVTNGAM